MSRATMVGGATLLLLVLLGVLAVLAQTAEEVPTELYVRTIPSGATILVDGRQQGTSPALLQVEPGERTVVVSLAGHQPRTKKVTIRDGRIKRVILELSKGPDAGGAAIDSAPPLAKPRQVRLLNADRSRQLGTPAVLDLASGELIAQPKTADDAAIAQYWDQLGRGDLAYPGEGLMVLRRGTVEQWNPATKRFTPAKAVYQEPRGATKPLVTGYPLENLPLRFRITSGDGKKYDLTVLKRKFNGDYVEIEYRPLPNSESPAQKSGKAAAGAAEPRNETPEDLAKTVVECLRQRDWMALVRFTVVSDDQWQPLEERARRALLNDSGNNPLHLDTRKGSHAEEILQDWRRFVERGERDFDIDWTQAEYECAEYRIAKSEDVVAIGRLDFVFTAGGKYYRASIDDVLLTDRGWLAAHGPKWVGQLETPVVSLPVETEIVHEGTAQSGWGPAVDGVQVRLGTVRPQFEEGEAPAFRADVRNRGSRDLFMWKLPVDGWEIQVDGQWYRRNFRNTLLPHVLPAGGEQKNLELTFETRWQDKPVWLRTDDEKMPLRWRPGKHTVRVAVFAHHPQGIVIPTVRAESNAVQIEILPKEPAAKSTALPQPKLSPRKLFSASHGEDVSVLAVAFSPDGKTVAAVDEAAMVILRDGRSGRQMMSFDLLTPVERKVMFRGARRQEIRCGAIAFSPDGTTLAVGGGPFGKLFDAQTGHLRRTLRDESLIADSDGWNGLPADQREKLGSIERAHGSVHCVAFSPDGSWLATSGGHIFEATAATRGALKLWDAKTGECEHDLGEHFGAVFAAAFSPDGKALASVGKHPPAWTASVRLWEPEDGRVVSVLRVSRGDPWSVAFSPDGKLLAAGGIVHNSEDDSTSGMLLIWNARTGALLLNRPRPSPVASVAFSADGKTLAAGEYERGVTLWHPETLNQKGEIQPQTDLPRDLKGTVCVAFSPSDSLLAIGAENEKHGFVTVWETGQP